MGPVFNNEKVWSGSFYAFDALMSQLITEESADKPVSLGFEDQETTFVLRL